MRFATRQHTCLRCGATHDCGIDAALCCATENETEAILLSIPQRR
jgi:hypothetical protein